MLAEIYQTDVLCLLDFADHESLPQPYLLVLTRRPRAGTLSGELAELAEPARTAQVVARGDEEDIACWLPGGEALQPIITTGQAGQAYSPYLFGAWGEFTVIAGWAAAALILGGLLLHRRDA
jgi:hypothetical protein